jgi:hypothetical protein
VEIDTVEKTFGGDGMMVLMRGYSPSNTWKGHRAKRKPHPLWYFLYLGGQASVLNCLWNQPVESEMAKILEKGYH